MNATGSGFAYIHVEPMSSKSIVSGLTKHYTRNFKGGFSFVDPKTKEPIEAEIKQSIAMDKGPKHIDYARSKDNEMLVGNENLDVMKEAMERVTCRPISDEEWKKVRKYDRKKESDGYESAEPSDFDFRYTNGRHIQKNVVNIVDMVMTYPGAVKIYHTDENGNRVEHPEVDYKYFREHCDQIGMDRYRDPNTGKIVSLYALPADKEEFEKWKQTAMQWVKERMGSENILLAALHMDETMPHIHVQCTPIVKDRDGVTKFAYKDFFSYQDFAQLQTDFASAFNSMGYKRGTEGSITTHLSPKEAQQIITNERRPVPEDPEEMYKYIRQLQEQVGHQKVEIIEKRKAGEDIERMQERINKLHTKNAELMREKEKMKAEMERMAADQKRSIAYQQLMQTIQLGIQKLQKTDKELSDAYVNITNNVVEMGDEEIRRLGLKFDELEKARAQGRVSGERIFGYNGFMMDMDFDGHDDRIEDDNPLTVEDESRQEQDNN